MIATAIAVACEIVATHLARVFVTMRWRLYFNAEDATNKVQPGLGLSSRRV
jgi:hypothetical protein